ncbi:MAG: serine hydrolase, partial [Chromatocurvus sp.]
MRLVLSTFLLLLVPFAAAASPAGDSNLMQGAPPPPDKRVTRENFLLAPYIRWSLQHVRELYPTRPVYPAPGPPMRLPASPRDLSAVCIDGVSGKPLGLDDWLRESATDALVILHGGDVVYERYFNGQSADTRHQMFSATKSVTGLLMALLAQEGRVDRSREVREFLPELSDSAYGDATVEQVMDMTVALDFNEDYADPDADIARFGYVFGIAGPPQGYPGPLTVEAYLATLQKSGEHGKAFHYITPDSEVLGWILRRVSQVSLATLLEQRLWQPMGAEHSAYYWLDHGATEMAGAGLNMTARDAARLGLLLLRGGQYQGRRVLPGSVVAEIFEPGNRSVFNRHYQDRWHEEIAYAYHDQWWTFNNAHKAVSAIGVHGQFIYLDPVADVVIV